MTPPVDDFDFPKPNKNNIDQFSQVKKYTFGGGL